MLQLQKFARESKTKDGRAEMCMECVKHVTGRTTNRQKKKRGSRYREVLRDQFKLSRHVWLFPGGFTFPRAEMFRPGWSLKQVFDEHAIEKYKTGRKI